MKIKVTTRRAPSVVAQVGNSRIESADGSRWAYSRNRKMSLGFGRYDIVKSWVVRTNASGKVVTVHGNTTEEAALEFVLGPYLETVKGIVIPSSGLGPLTLQELTVASDYAQLGLPAEEAASKINQDRIRVEFDI